MQLTPETVSPHMRAAGMPKRHDVSHSTALASLQRHCDIDARGRSMGVRAAQSHLVTKANLRLPRAQVARVMQQHNPAAHQGRRERPLRRQAYINGQPHSVLHIDSAPAPHCSCLLGHGDRPCMVGVVRALVAYVDSLAPKRGPCGSIPTPWCLRHPFFRAAEPPNLECLPALLGNQ